jgi:Plasmid pRiA4b ORF-3-like protein.
MAVSSVPKKKHKSSLSKPCLITLRIELVGTTPLVWRRITLDCRSSFANLHHVIQAAMGWHDAHLHQFRINNRYIGVPDPESDAPEWHTEDERKVFLNRVLTDDAVFTYLYDFGDGWEHRLLVEEYDDSDDLRFGDGDAWVDAGERACPPEDCGGVGGFQDFLEKLENEPYSDESKELRVWAGLDYDPARFDRLAANAAIKRLLWNRWLK